MANCNLSVLLEDTPESLYWCGFLSADGTVQNNDKRISLTLSEKDEEHLLRYKKFIECDNKTLVIEQTKSLRVSTMDSIVVPKIVKKRFLFERKTYNPPKDIPARQANLRFAYAVGFTDGDGTIQYQSGGRKDSLLTVKCHSSWENMLGVISEELCGENKVKINGDGYSVFYITDMVMLKKITRLGITWLASSLSGKLSHWRRRP